MSIPPEDNPPSPRTIDLVRGLGVVEEYFKQTQAIEDNQQTKLLKFAPWISIVLIIIGYGFLLFQRQNLVFLGAVLVLSGLGLSLLASLMDGAKLVKLLSHIPLAHLQVLKVKAVPTKNLYENLIELDIVTLKLLYISLKHQKDYTHNVNKFMLGDLGFIPTTLLGASGILTLKNLFGIQILWVSIFIGLVAFLSFIGFYIRSSVESYQKVLDILQNLIDREIP